MRSFRDNVTSSSCQYTISRTLNLEIMSPQRLTIWHCKVFVWVRLHLRRYPGTLSSRCRTSLRRPTGAAELSYGYVFRKQYVKLQQSLNWSYDVLLTTRGWVDSCTDHPNWCRQWVRSLHAENKLRQTSSPFLSELYIGTLRARQMSSLCFWTGFSGNRKSCAVLHFYGHIWGLLPLVNLLHSVVP